MKNTIKPMKTAKTKPFREIVAAYSAKHIAQAIGCSVPTAYDWRSGRRSPPKWLQQLYADILKGSD
tara:strand:- start:224 stop:421 length:198 start_codon:yes stop_codon:yes gene_type:complete